MKRNGFKVTAKLIGLVRPLAGYMLLAVIMGIIGNLCASFITIFGVCALSQALGFPFILEIKTLFILMALFALARAFLRYAEQRSNHFIAFKLLALIRDRVFTALRKLAPAKLESKDKGNLIALITADIELLEVFYAHTLSPIAIAFSYSLLLCLFIGSYHWLLGIIAALAYLTIGIVAPLLISKASGDTGMEFRNKAGELSSYILDSLRGLDETIQYADGENRLNEIIKRSESLANDAGNLKRKEGIGAAVVNIVLIVFDLTMFFTSALLYHSGIIPFNGVMIATVALMSSFGPTLALAGLGSTLQYTFAAGNRVLDILEEEPVVKDITEGIKIEFTGAATKHLTFAYAAENVLEDLNITIPKGKIIGIVGKSGSGKSTLLKLFMRFWEADKGEVLIAEKNVNEINTKNLRDTESFVTQDTQLFKDTILNNLLIAKPDASFAEVVRACQKAAVHDFISSLPHGYATDVSELGDNLSDGERQRLGLARAFLRDAPFMLLDEPTSNLDSLNEALILKALHRQHEDKTVVLVSHRNSTMQIADQVYSLKNGRMS